MVSCALFVVAPLWIHMLTQACRGEELSREVVLSWFGVRVLEGLGMEKPPSTTALRHRPRRAPIMRRALFPNHQTGPNQDTSQVILFPTSDSSFVAFDSALGETTESHFTYYFLPSVNHQEVLVTSAHFWFYAGEGATANASASLFLLTSAQQLLQVAEDPTETSSDGWTTYRLCQSSLASVAEGPFLLQVRCPTCLGHAEGPNKMPFVHLHTQPRGPARPVRSVSGTIPWSPSALDLLQRPSLDRPQSSDCDRAEIELSFEELGWDNWIVHPKSLTFSYCHGNCSAWDRTAAMLGITQCCAPVPGTMKSLTITTTSDGGYSFKYETLPNIIPEECTCI